MSRLVEHAERELGRINTDEAFANSLIAAVRGFASYGHSGGSAAVGIELLNELLRFRALSPLTSNEEEWFDHGEQSDGRGLWQNKRDSAAMSRDGGESWYYVDGREPGPPEPDGGELYPNDGDDGVDDGHMT